MCIARRTDDDLRQKSDLGALGDLYNMRRVASCTKESRNAVQVAGRAATLTLLRSVANGGRGGTRGTPGKKTWPKLVDGGVLNGIKS